MACRSADIGSSDRRRRASTFSGLPANQGYVVNVQSDLVSEKVATRVVVPLVPVTDIGKPIADLNPVVRIDDFDYAVVARSLATLTSREMGERTGSLLADHGDRFDYALDILLIGF